MNVGSYYKKCLCLSAIMNTSCSLQSRLVVVTKSKLGMMMMTVQRKETLADCHRTHVGGEMMMRKYIQSILST